MTPLLRPTDRDIPVIALTCGDPAGIGPEVACLAWAEPAAHAHAALRVVAEPAMLAAALRDRRGMPALEIEVVSFADRRPSTPGTLLVAGTFCGPRASIAARLKRSCCTKR
jgi:4-hydroxy-L-threonine phosphate dehydrogenase PdxA